MRDKLSRITTKVSRTLFDTKMFLKGKGNKYPLLFSLFGVLLSSLSVIGVTYSLWTDTAETGNNSISTGTISMRYVEDMTFAAINNAEHMTAQEAYQSNNYFPFQVVMEASGEAELYYEITVTTQNTTTFSYDTDQKIRIGIKKENNIVTDAGFNIEGSQDNVNYTNGVIVGTLPTSGSVTTGNPQTVYKGTISSNGTETVHNFKLYLWLDENAPANSVSEKYALTINVNTGDNSPSYGKYTLTYNNQGGLGCSTKQVRPNNPWGTLCTPAKEGYAFSGWYTGENGTGTEVTSTTTASSNTQVYAYYTPSTLYTVMKSFAEEGTYAATYSGDSNDTYGVVGTKTIYYIKAADSTVAAELLDKINVKFAGYCWQILRTTDTGGVKLIYNGEPDSNGYCKAINTQDTHKGVIGARGSSVAMSGDYQYADSYTYDLTAGTFTLVNPSQDNYANNKNLIGKYTCMTSSSTTTCSTLYYLNTPNRATVNSPYTVTYTIGDTQNAQLGTTPFNANYRSPAYIGYKYGTAYDYVANSAPTSGSIMGHDVYWNGSNYELRESDNSVSSGTEYDTDHHYTCNSASATCTGGKVRYYYYGNYYIELLNGDDIDTALTRMLEANTYDSAMKSYLENWFRNKMLTYKDYLDENTVYCNDRSITQIGGWTNTGGIGTGSTNYLKFTNYSISVTDLSCTKDTDKFSVGNSNAELNYPVGLATAPEMNIMTNATLRNTGQVFWLVSPYYFRSDYANERYVYSSGSVDSHTVGNTYGARPVVSLAPSNDPISGTGAYDNPYVIGE